MVRAKMGVVMLLLLTLVVLPGVGSLTLAEEEPITLRLATWSNRLHPSNVAAWEEVLAGWYEKYPHITIDLQVIPFSSYFDKVGTLIATGSIDVLDISDAWIAQYATSGSLVDLTPLIERDLDLDDYFQVSLDRGRYPFPDGNMYSIWTFMSPAIMYVNKDLFDLSGVEVSHEWSYEDMEVIAQRLYRDTDGNGVPEQAGFGQALGNFAGAGRRGYGIGSILRSFGATDYTPDGKWYALDSPEHIAAYNFAYSFIERGLTTLDMGSSQFQQGMLGLGFDGSFVAARLAESATFSWTMVTPPAGPAGRMTMLHGNPSMAIAAHTPYPEEAWAFIRHVLESQTATSVYLTGNMPTKRSAAEDWIRMGAELWPGFDPQAVMASIEGAVYVPIISPLASQAESTINSILNRAARGEMPFAAALEEATRRANAIIAEDGR